MVMDKTLLILLHSLLSGDSSAKPALQDLLIEHPEYQEQIDYLAKRACWFWHDQGKRTDDNGDLHFTPFTRYKPSSGSLKMIKDQMDCPRPRDSLANRCFREAIEEWTGEIKLGT